MARGRVLQLVTGGIAAYKSCLLTRLLVQAGLSVRVAMTDSAQRFVGPVTFRALSGQPVATDLWGEGESLPLDHIEYARWADVAVVAPATANLLAKAAAGVADDIVTTLLLAHEGPLLVAPAMNDAMWRHPATQANVRTLAERGVEIVAPGEGWLACGTEAPGRMAEPEEILARVVAALDTVLGAPPPDALGELPLAGRRLLITAGPTREPLDAVRFLSNRSTGAMGFALARAATARGAAVTLVHGPTPLPPPSRVARRIPVETAAEMAAAVAEQLPRADALIMSAAVADFTPSEVDQGKLRKESLGTEWRIPLTRTVDILADIVALERRPDQLVVGFALETGDLIARAEEKRRAKGLDFIVANDLAAPDTAFGPGEHHVVLIGPEGIVWDSGPADKETIASELIDRLVPALTDRKERP